MCSPYDEIASVNARHEYVLVSLRFMVEVVMSTIHVLHTMHGRLLAAMIGESGYSVFLCLLYLCASLSVLWLRCLRHGLRGGVSCAAFAAWADGDGRRSLISTIRLVLPYVSVDCSASVSRRGVVAIDGGCESGDAVVVCGAEGADRKCYGRG